MTVTRDATSGWYVPANATEWTELLAGTGISNPAFLWLCQEASGNLADSIGACTLTAANTPGYSGTVSGWTRKAVTWVDGNSSRFTNTTTPPDGSTSSLAMLGYFYVTSTGAVHRGCMSVTNFAVSLACNNGKFECIDNAVGTGIETISDGVVRPCLLVYNRAKSTCRLYYRRTANATTETIDGSYTSSAGVNTVIGAVSGILTPTGGCLYAAQWTGTAAEMNDTQAMLVLDLLALGPLAGRSITRDATSNWYTPANIGEWFLLLKGTGINPPTLQFGMQDTSGALTAGLIDSIGAFNPGINASVGNFQNAVTGWTRKGILLSDGATHIATIGNWPGGSSMALMLGWFPASVPAATRSVMTFGGTYAAQVAADLTNGSNPTLLNIATHGDVFHPGSQSVASSVHPLIVQNNQTTQIGLIQTDLETVSFAQTNADSMGALILGGNNASTWFAGGVVYMYVVAWDAADAEMDSSHRSTLLSVMQNGPLSTFTYFSMTQPERPRYRTFRQPMDRSVGPMTPIANVTFDPRVGHAYYPDRAPGKMPTMLRGLVAERMNISPLGSPFVPVLGAMAEIPDNPPKRRPPISHRAQSLALGPLPQGSPAPVPGRGPNGTVIVVQAEDGATVTWSWGTDIITAHDGTEHRIGTTDCPRDSYAFSAGLTDAQAQAIQSALIRRAAKGQVFLLSDMSESTTITANSTGVAVNVSTTQYMDWIYVGSRVCVLDQDTGVAQSGVVQSSSSNQIVLDTSVTVSYGDVIMPLRHVYLDAQQKMGSYAVNATQYDFTAKAFLYGDASSNWTVHGATVTTYNGLPVFTGGNEANSLVGRAFATGAELIDFGGEIQQYGPEISSKVARELRYTMRTDADRQWFKAFLKAVQGKQIKFYLPTWRNDFTVTGTALGNQVITYSSATAYAAQWSQTGAHNQVQIITTTGTILYRLIVAATDNGDGTESMQLDSGFAGSILAISFLEQCRLDQDDVVVTWDKAIGSTALQAMTCKQ